MLRIGPWTIGPVTEPEAYVALLGHLKSCPLCAAMRRAADQCQAGVRLHAAWKEAEQRQAPAPRPRRAA